MYHPYERKINYYETDKMGIVHHSNYIRFLEEARCSMLEAADMPYSEFEKHGVLIPVLNVNCNYKCHITYGDTIIVNTLIKEFNGVRLTIQYEITNKETGDLVLTAETEHCFTNKKLKPLRLQKQLPDFYNKFYLLKNT